MTIALWGLDESEWSALAASVAALAAVLTLVVATIAAVIAVRQLRASEASRRQQAKDATAQLAASSQEAEKNRAAQAEQAQRLREQQAQPYIAVSLEGSAAGDEFLELVVKNYGLTAAHNVVVTFDPPLQRTSNEDPSGLEDVLVPDVFPVLVPGQEWRTFWDTTVERNRRWNPEDERDFRNVVPPPDAVLPPERHDVVVLFDDSTGRPLGPLNYVLDWQVERSKGAIVVRTLHHAADAIRDLSKDFHKLVDSRNLRVQVRDGDAADQRRRDHREERERHENENRPPGR